MISINNKYFITLLFLSAFIIEGSAAFFSVYGLSKLFSGATLAVAIMSGGLEFAKVISASYLYRYWNVTGILFKTYMTSAVVILMLITSMGIYGFLSNAFQGSTLGMEKEISKLEMYEQELTRIVDNNNTLKLEKSDLQKNLNDEMSGLVIKEDSRYTDISRRASTQKRYQILFDEKELQITENNSKIENINTNISDIKLKLIDTGADVGPIIFVAKVFNVDISVAVQYIILLFIIVFDPLALALIIAYNKVLLTKNINTKNSTPIPSKEDTLQAVENSINIENDIIETKIDDEISNGVESKTDTPNETTEPHIITNLMKTYDDGNVVDVYDESVDTQSTKLYPTPIQTSSF